MPASNLSALLSTHTPPRERVRVVAAVIERDSRFLICLRPAHKRHGGLWEFPGGKVDEGETEKQAVERELKEELGVETTSVAEMIFSSLDEGGVFDIRFIPASILGEPAALEHADLAWCSWSQLLDYPLAPSDRAFAEFIASRAS